MKPEAQRIAIAEHYSNNGLGEPCGYINSLPRASQALQLFPDYLNDLNAMHEAENVLAGLEKEMRMAYVQELGLVFGIDEGVEWTTDEDWTLLHATAADRAKAFLRTIGKWMNCIE